MNSINEIETHACEGSTLPAVPQTPGVSEAKASIFVHRMSEVDEHFKQFQF